MPQPSADIPDKQQSPQRRPPSGSQTPSPDDHLKTLIEFLKPGSAELVRRWIAALLLAPEGERECIVEAVEARIVELYALDEGAAEQPGRGASDDRFFHVADEPIQRQGHVEQTVRTYSKAAEESLDQGTPEQEQAGDEPRQRRNAAE